MDITAASTPLSASGHSRHRPDRSIEGTARDLETAFLSNMLQSAGTARMPGSLNGGPGEEHFASFIADAQARAMVAAGGLGLAGIIAASLARQRHEAG